MKCIIRSSISLRVNDNLLTNHNDIVDHVVTHFTNHNSTSILQDNNLIVDVIPNLITGHINNLLTLLLSSEEIHNAVFAMSPNNALGPDGLEGEFFLSIRRSSRMIWLILC